MEQSGEQQGIEGCLSVPGISGQVVRPQKNKHCKYPVECITCHFRRPYDDIIDIYIKSDIIISKGKIVRISG